MHTQTFPQRWITMSNASYLRTLRKNRRGCYLRQPTTQTNILARTAWLITRIGHCPQILDYYTFFPTCPQNAQWDTIPSFIVTMTLKPPLLTDWSKYWKGENFVLLAKNSLYYVIVKPRVQVRKSAFPKKKKKIGDKVT